jgi:hypothetical protein
MPRSAIPLMNPRSTPPLIAGSVVLTEEPNGPSSAWRVHWTRGASHGLSDTIGLAIVHPSPRPIGTEVTLGVEVPGIYWHFVDIMWIIVFLAVYII